MARKKVSISIAALVIAIMSLVIVAFPHVKRSLEVGVPLPNPKVGKKIKLRERFFNRADPAYSEVLSDDVVIEEVADNRVKVKTRNGYEVSQSINPFVPSFEEKSTDPKQEYVEKNTFFGDPLALFPLKVGKKTSNKVAGHTTQKGGRAWEYTYECEVTGKEGVQIALGSFDTYKVVCTAAGNVSFKKTFFYDPKSETVVLSARDSDSPYYSEVIEVTNP